MQDNKTPILRAKNLTKSLGGRLVLGGVHLTLKQGEVVGLLGPNGAGKTTFFSLLAGLIMPDQGQIFLNRLNITGLPMYMRARLGIRYLPQESSVFRGMTVADNLLAIIQILEPEEHKHQRILQATCDEFNLNHLQSVIASKLSGGERRRLEIARAVLGNPHFILMDEPLAGIDPKMIRDVCKLIKHLKDRGIGVLLTEHNVAATFRVVDRAYIIHEGYVLKEGTPDEIRHDQEVRNVYLGHDFI
jgi:lipopolysaccharide export system ATP-binding protein